MKTPQVLAVVGFLRRIMYSPPDVGFALSRINLTAPTRTRVFTAPLEPKLSRSWPQHLDLPIERRWDLFGLGLCPVTKQAPRRWRRRFREANIIACLQRCDTYAGCRTVSFSQEREDCILSYDRCREADLTRHVSYATFIPASLDDLSPLVGLERWPMGGGKVGDPETVHLFASTSPRVDQLWNLFAGSIRLAQDPVVVLRQHLPHADTTNKTRERMKIPWPHLDEDYVAMHKRDRLKITSLARTLWTCFSLGIRRAVVSDVDVQVFPGWTDTVKACTTRAHICVTQQPGSWFERKQPVNSGFIAFQVNSVSLSLVLRLAAQYENEFLYTNMRKVRLEQEVLASFLFDHCHGLWAIFSPAQVAIFVDPVPEQVLRVKVQHACGSNVGSRPMSMYRTRRLYYSLLPFCLSRHISGPQHPCCDLHGWERSPYDLAAANLPPFRMEATFGPGLGLPYGALGGQASDDDYDMWKWVVECQSLKMDNIYAWTLAYPMDEFLQGRSCMAHHSVCLDSGSQR